MIPGEFTTPILFMGTNPLEPQENSATKKAVKSGKWVFQKIKNGVELQLIPFMKRSWKWILAGAIAGGAITAVALIALQKQQNKEKPQEKIDPSSRQQPIETNKPLPLKKEASFSVDESGTPPKKVTKEKPQRPRRSVLSRANPNLANLLSRRAKIPRNTRVLVPGKHPLRKQESTLNVDMLKNRASGPKGRTPPSRQPRMRPPA